MPRYFLEMIILLLVILWAMGYFVVNLGGDLIHILLVVILVVIVIRLLQGRSAL